MTAKRLGLKCILDIDFRPNLWGLQGHDAGSSRWAEASEQVTSEYKKVLPYFDLIVGTEEEFFIAGGKTEAMEALREVRRLSKALLVFKLGDKGCAALPGDIPDSFVDEVVYPGFPVKVFNSIGAGDGSCPASCAAGCAMRIWPPRRYANAAGAFAVSASAAPQPIRAGPSCNTSSATAASISGCAKTPCSNRSTGPPTVATSGRTSPCSPLTTVILLRAGRQETGRDAKAITAFKNLAFRAVAEASSELEGQNDVGILVDDTYGQSVLFESNRYPVLGGPFH